MVDNLQAADFLSIRVRFLQRSEFLTLAAGKEIIVMIELAPCRFVPAVGIVLAQLDARNSHHAESLRVASLRPAVVEVEEVPRVRICVMVSESENLVIGCRISIDHIISVELGVERLGGMRVEISLVTACVGPVYSGVGIDCKSFLHVGG